MTNNAALVFAQSTAGTFSGISSLATDGPETLTVTGPNTYPGGDHGFDVDSGR
jgi:hypothetical protein